jgi:hypothetical protein
MTKPAPRQNIVLGCGTGYTPNQLLPFVSTLRGAGFTGQMALVVYADQLKKLAGLADRFAVTLVPIARLPGWLPAGIGTRLQNRGRIKSLHRAMAALLPPLLRVPGILESLGMPLHHFFHIACSRYFIYYSYLHTRRTSCANVLLSDVRDVIFQADPFQYSNDGGLYCYMDSAVKLGDEPINTEWMTRTYGQACCASHLGKPVVCSGTTMGDVDAILAYLREMCVELMRALPRIVGLHGVDQAVHNCLIWQGRLPGAVLRENGRHAVMTLKNADIGAFRMDKEGRLLNLDGNPAPVLHQYDFHPDLAGGIKREGS